MRVPPPAAPPLRLLIAQPCAPVGASFHSNTSQGRTPRTPSMLSHFPNPAGAQKLRWQGPRVPNRLSPAMLIVVVARRRCCAWHGHAGQGVHFARNASGRESEDAASAIDCAGIRYLRSCFAHCAYALGEGIVRPPPGETPIHLGTVNSQHQRGNMLHYCAEPVFHRCLSAVETYLLIKPFPAQ